MKLQTIMLGLEVALACVVALAPFGCHSRGEPSGAMGGPEAYAALEPSEAGPKVSFSKPGALKSYDAFYVDPVAIYTNDKGRLVPAASREIDNLAKSFREKIIRALGDRHTMFDQPARNTAIIRVVITDVWSNRALLNLRPGLVVPNALEGGASMEAEIISSVSKKRVALITDSRPGTRKGFMSGLTKWGGTEAAFDDWAMLLKQSIRQGST